ncbi:MAG: PEP-CTERM/exosortase system-associated acyltransferase [Salinisphaera sp.]|jgi:N-acyl amino acid synthase of PEP-CTERM/exosortase system|nr:PEP-CTERM/exosortase system-associated acyltransferase [Salinisphaera sp.]
MIDFSFFFNRHLQVVTDPEQEILDEAFRLRYQVYCLEKGFEKHETCIDRREQDEYDHHSLHGIVRHRDTDTTMATVRLVRPTPDDSVVDFPLEQSHPDLLLSHGITDKVLPRASTGEISRFAISKDCQQRMRSLPDAGISQSVTGSGWRFNGRRYPLVTFGLFVALMRLSQLHGITHWLAVMEPSLLRLLSRFGISFTPIGGVIEYHGRRQPCYGAVDDIRRRVSGTEFDLCELVKHDIAASRMQRRPKLHQPVVIPQKVVRYG